MILSYTPPRQYDAPVGIPGWLALLLGLLLVGGIGYVCWSVRRFRRKIAAEAAAARKREARKKH
ncbi:hypothetical protein ACIRD8_09390 [Streptomyces sp. NPDC102451]|uniref:hypothetical protein n=1 Tax=Streptomyces sp. NPDC102451 TaxID=3366177 RepID=UPI003802F126